MPEDTHISVKFEVVADGTFFGMTVTVRQALLKALLKGPSFGLELVEATRGRIHLNPLSVYPALRLLEDEGLVFSYDGEGEPVAVRMGRPRRYYELTEKGRAEATAA